MILDRLFERRATKQILGHPRDPILKAFFGGTDNTSGVDVNENTAMKYSVCWAATRLYSGTGGRIPLKLYRRLPRGGKEEAVDHPVYKLAHSRPNSEMVPAMFRGTRIAQQVNSGNGYAEIEWDNSGRPIATWPIQSWRVRPFRAANRSLWYEIHNNDGTTGHLPASDILHFPNVISDDGIVGKGVVEAARERIGFGIAIQRHGSNFFGNGARPGIIITHPQKMSDTARQNFRREWNERHQGPENAHNLALLSEGADIKELGFSNVDSQFIESDKLTAVDLARYYGVPQHAVGILDRATNNNIEHQGTELVTYALIPLLVIIEQEYSKKLLTEEEQEEYFFEHVVDALLRGDAASRTEALRKQWECGALTLNQWNAIENRNPLPDGMGDEHFIPLNMTTVEKMKEAPVEVPSTKPVETSGIEPAVNPKDEERSLPSAGSLAIAHRTALVQVFGRLIRKEAQAARRATNKPREFQKWLDEFYGEHEGYFAAESMPALRTAYLVLSPSVDAQDESLRIAKRHIEKARKELLDASDGDPDKFKESIEQCVAFWEESRANTLADDVLSNLAGEAR